MEFKLGLNFTPEDRPLLMMNWLKGVPSFPPVADHFGGGWQMELGMNQKYGVCGPVSCENHRRMTTKLLTGLEDRSTQDDIFDLYRRSGNPNFDPVTGRGDNGVDMATMLQACLKGGLSGDKLIGYARLADQSDPSVMAAIDVFGGVLLAVNLQAAQQAQTNQGLWDYVRSGPWGGHAVAALSYDQLKGRVDVVTWAMRVGTTAAFRSRQLMEAWVPLWPEIVTSGKLFDAGVDYRQLAQDYQDLTGKPFPAPLPNPPTPTPTTGGKLTFDTDYAQKTVLVTAPADWNILRKNSL